MELVAVLYSFGEKSFCWAIDFFPPELFSLWKSFFFLLSVCSGNETTYEVSQTGSGPNNTAFYFAPFQNLVISKHATLSNQLHSLDVLLCDTRDNFQMIILNTEQQSVHFHNTFWVICNPTIWSHANICKKIQRIIKLRIYKAFIILISPCKNYHKRMGGCCTLSYWAYNYELLYSSKVTVM